MKLTNQIYPELKRIINENSGFSGSTWVKYPDALNQYQSLMNELRQFDNKKVTLSFNYSNDWLNTSGVKTGKIKVIDDRIRFYEGRKRARFFYLDAGLYEGFYAVLIFQEVNTL